MHICLSSPRFLPQCWCLHPSPPTLRLVCLYQSFHGRSCLLTLAPKPRGLPCALSASLSPWSVSPTPELPRPTASPASLLASQSWLSAPAPGPTSYHCHSQEICDRVSEKTDHLAPMQFVQYGPKLSAAKVTK